MAFLTARLAEDEQVARRAVAQHERAVAACKAGRPADMEDLPGETAADWSGGSDEDGRGRWRQAVWAGEGFVTLCEMADEYDGATPEHMARHDPARVLAEVGAKRRIVKRHRPWREDEDDVTVSGGRLQAGQCYECEGQWVPCPTLRLLALPYAAHPGYLAEWAPTEEVPS